MTGRGDESCPEASRVVVRAEGGADLELTAVARASVDVTELERAAETSAA